jgi:hypothetical protein
MQAFTREVLVRAGLRRYTKYKNDRAGNVGNGARGHEREERRDILVQGREKRSSTSGRVLGCPQACFFRWVYGIIPLQLQTFYYS